MGTKLLCVVCACLLFAGCGGGEAGSEAPGSGSEAASSPDSTEEPETETVADGTLTVSGGEWSFTAAAEAVAGPTTVTYENTGTMSHELIIAELPGGTSLEALSELDDRKRILKQVKQVAASGRVFRGETSEPFEVDLKPGSYALLCLLASPRGRTHAWVGMFSELNVE